MKGSRQSWSQASKDLDDNDLYGTFELRADLLVKEGHLVEALEDANVMVRIQSKNPRGYLRLGQILMLLEKYKEAAEIYLRAIKRVSPNEECYKMLLSLEKKARSRHIQNCAPKRDPLTRLPPELLYLIFSQFPLQERIQFSRVSKRWLEYFRHEAKFWNDIQLRLKPTMAIGSETLITYISRSQLPLRLDIAETAVRRPEKLLQHIARNCRIRTTCLLLGQIPNSYQQLLLDTLRELGKPFPNLVRLSIQTDAMDLSLDWCLKNMPALEDLELKSVLHCRSASLSTIDIPEIKLKRIKLLGSNNRQHLKVPVANALSMIKTLELFELHQVTPDFQCLSPIFDNEHLESFGFTAQGTCPLNIAVPRFKSTKIKSLALNKVAIDMRNQRFGGLPLEYLELKWTTLHHGSLGDVLSGLQCTTTLQTLVVHHCSLSWPIATRQLVLPQLVTFQFTEMPAIDKASLRWILDAIRHVKRVNVDHTPLTGPELMQIISLGVTHLRCKENPMSYEFVEWLQSENKGRVKVQF